MSPFSLIVSSDVLHALQFLSSFVSIKSTVIKSKLCNSNGNKFDRYTKNATVTVLQLSNICINWWVCERYLYKLQLTQFFQHCKEFISLNIFNNPGGTHQHHRICAVQQSPDSCRCTDYPKTVITNTLSRCVGVDDDVRSHGDCTIRFIISALRCVLCDVYKLQSFYIRMVSVHCVCCPVDCLTTSA